MDVKSLDKTQDEEMVKQHIASTSPKVNYNSRNQFPGPTNLRYLMFTVQMKSIKTQRV